MLQWLGGERVNKVCLNTLPFPSISRLFSKSTSHWNTTHTHTHVMIELYTASENRSRNTPTTGRQVRLSHPVFVSPCSPLSYPSVRRFPQSAPYTRGTVFPPFSLFAAGTATFRVVVDYLARVFEKHYRHVARRFIDGSVVLNHPFDTFSRVPTTRSL